MFKLSFSLLSFPDRNFMDDFDNVISMWIYSFRILAFHNNQADGSKNSSQHSIFYLES